MRIVVSRLLITALVSLPCAVFAQKTVVKPLPPLRHYEAPAFPMSLSSAPITSGHATVAYTIDPAGKVIDALTLEANHPAFGDAVLAVLPNWDFEPAAANSIPRREISEFVFSRQRVAALSHADSAKAAFSATLDNADAVKTVSWEQTESKPQRLVSALPAYPPTLKAKGITGNATVSFVIDGTGAVRVPAAVTSSDPAFAEAALNAVKQWKYSQPRDGRHSTQLEVVRSFSFGKTLAP